MKRIAMIAIIASIIALVVLLLVMVPVFIDHIKVSEQLFQFQETEITDSQRILEQTRNSIRLTLVILVCIGAVFLKLLLWAIPKSK